MFVKVHKSSGDVKGGNTGSCEKLIDYLGKEDDKDEGFFSHSGNKIDPDLIIEKIDNNKKGLGKNDEKFFMITINPSHAEQEGLIIKSCGSSYYEQEFSNIDEMSPEMREKLSNEIKDYSRKVMDIYAQNFERDNVKDGDDLLYYGRVEFDRTYKHYDNEVKDGKARPGDKRPGLNMHVHIVVSRKSKDSKTKLSPNVKSRGNSWDQNGNKKKRGFDHERFKINAQKTFTKTYGYCIPQDSYLHSSFYRSKNNRIEREQQNRTSKSAKVATADIVSHGAKHALTNQVKQTAKQAVKGGQSDILRNEKKIKRSAEEITAVLRSPKMSVINKVKQILSGVASGAESAL